MTEDFKIMTVGDSEKIENLSQINDNLALLNESFLALSTAVTSLIQTQVEQNELLKQQNKSLEEIVSYMDKFYTHQRRKDYLKNDR